MSDLHAGDQVSIVCPSCSPHDPTVHEVLKPDGHATVRCRECHHVHKTRIESTQDVEITVIVSQGGESFRTRLEADPDETIETGEEFIVDTEEAIHQVRVTGIEIGEDRRTEQASIAEVETVWTRVVDNVSVNVTLHPKDGSRDETRSIAVQVPGDYELTVGETETFGDDEFSIEGLYVRADASGYKFDKFDHEGDMVFAKDVKRVYARDETSTAWSAW
ncbi:MAG: HVO_0476 family zinc finger protein [Halobacteriota archaeon]